MKVFISWSGEKSRDVANALRDWIPDVLQAVEPFVSSRDVAAGSRWALEIAERLDDANFGLVCVTRENQHMPWLNFETGAIAKSLDASRVIPVAIDLTPAQIDAPLGQFQATRPDREGMGEILRALNDACESPLPGENLERATDKWWPAFSRAHQEIEEWDYPTSEVPSSARSDSDMLEEILGSVRDFSRAAPPAQVAPGSMRFEDDLRTVLVNAGVRSWTLAYTAPNEFQLKIDDGPVTQRLFEELTFLERLRGVSMQIAPEPSPPPTDHGAQR